MYLAEVLVQGAGGESKGVEVECEGDGSLGNCESDGWSEWEWR